jgi:hypothetical protein
VAGSFVVRGDSDVAADEYGGIPPGMGDVAPSAANDANAEGEPAEPMEGMEPLYADAPSDAELINILQQCDTTVRTHYQAHLQARWATNYRAFANQHYDGSKYGHDAYKARSKFFRPKTRAMVERNLTATAAAFFATADVVQTSAGNDTDRAQRASAALMGELLNYRLDRKAGRNGIPWFSTVLGARFDCQMTSMCVSWQGWRYLTRTRLVPRYEAVPVFDAMGFPAVDPMTGMPQMKQVEAGFDEVQDVVADRSDIELVPADHTWIDPGAPWLDPAQNSAFLNLRVPMYAGDVRRMIEQTDPKCPFVWRDVTDGEIRNARINAGTEPSSKIARDGDNNPLTDRPNREGDLDIVWVDRFFVRTGGEDWFFYALGGKTILSDPMPVADAFPWNGGERPVVVGYDVLEPHKLYPMSQVEAVQPVQREINDVANLRLDNVKAVVSPVTKVKRGKQVDLAAVQRRGPNTTLLLTDMTDVEWDRPPDVTQSSYVEMEKLNIDFDEVGGVFNQGSVQSNRTMNETVGGLRLLSSAANSVSEYHLRIFVETWAEPVLAQLARLEQYYCDDAVVLGLAGQRAQLWQKYGLSEINDDLIEREVTVRVDVGIGAADPMQKLQKFQMATTMLAPLVAPAVQAGKAEINLRDIVNEVYGHAGYRDGGDRFITIKDQPEQQPKPEEQAAQQAAQAKAMLDMARAEQAKAETAKTRVETELLPEQLAVKAQEVMHKFQVASEQMIQENKRMAAEFFREMRQDVMKARQAAQPRPVPQARPPGRRPS